MTTDNKLADILSRLNRLETAVFNEGGTPRAAEQRKKIPSLPELVKDKPLQNGQQRIAAIVGYLEKLEHLDTIKLSDIKRGWAMGKFDGGFANVLVSRAMKDGLIADYSRAGNYVLTQTGEAFWDQINA